MALTGHNVAHTIITANKDADQTVEMQADMSLCCFHIAFCHDAIVWRNTVRNLETKLLNVIDLTMIKIQILWDGQLACSATMHNCNQLIQQCLKWNSKIPQLNHGKNRASTLRGTNTPGRPYFLMYKNNLSLWQWYKAKSMDHETCHWPTYILRGRSLCHTDPLSQVQHFSIKQSSRYEAKSLDHKI